MIDTNTTPPPTRLRDSFIQHHDEEMGLVLLYFQIHRYAHGGGPRIDLFHETEGPWATLTVNEPAIKLEPGELLIKSYAEGGYTAKSAIKSGFFTDTGKRVKVGYAIAEIWTLAEGVEL